MNCVLGMAKSNIDLRGANSPRTELDYLRLAYAVKELRRSGEGAKGYLLVRTQRIVDRTRKWETKYRCEGVVHQGL